MMAVSNREPPGSSVHGHTSAWLITNFSCTSAVKWLQDGVKNCGPYTPFSTLTSSLIMQVQ
jgi:hypothetical protein